MAGNFSVNANKPQSTDFFLQRPQNDIANSETSIFSEESRHKSISSIPKELIKLNKGDIKNNPRTPKYQSSSLKSQNKSFNPSPNNNQNQNASSSESEPLSNTSSRKSSFKNSKIESKKDDIIIGNSVLNCINEKGLSDERYKVKVKNHSNATTEDIWDFIKLELRKKPDIIIDHAGIYDITKNTKSFENYKKITDTIKSKLPNCKYAISNVVMRKDKPDIEKKVIEFNSRLSKFCSKNKIDIIENENLDGSCLSFKKLHLNKKCNSYLAKNFLDFLHSF